MSLQSVQRAGQSKTRVVINPKKPDERFESSIQPDEAMVILHDISENHPRFKHVSDKTRVFAKSLHNQWFDRRGISSGQWYWAIKIAHDATNVSPKPEPVKIAGGFSRIKAMFDSSKDSGKAYPKIRFSIPSLGEIRLSMAGRHSSSPGAINVTDDGPHGDNIWYGRVAIDGEFVSNPSPRIGDASRETVTKFLKLLAKNPAAVASEYGQRTGRCCFCGLELTDERSVMVGYGPICADRTGLPWGDRPVIDPADLEQLEGIINELAVH